MEKSADELNAKFVIRWKEGDTGGVLISRDLSAQEKATERLEQLADSQVADLLDLRRRRARAVRRA